jgi:hypothetical protein
MKILSLKKIAAISALILCVIKLAAQGDSLSQLTSDRTLQTETPDLLPQGFFQVETGFGYIDRNETEAETNRVKIASTTLRFGVFSHFEVRVASGMESVAVRDKELDIDSGYRGMDPLSAGFKVFVAHEKGIRPQMAILGNITFRHVGHEYLRPTFSYPLGKIICRHTLTKRLSVGYNAGFTWNGETADGFFIYSAYTGYDITKRLWSFAEVYGTFDAGNLPNHLGDVGLAYTLRNNLRMDLLAGLGFDRDIQKYWIGTGISWRIPR